MPKCINGKQPAAQEMLGEIWTFSEFARSAIYAAEMQAKEYPAASGSPTCGPLHALRATLPYWFPRVNEIIRLLGSHNLFAAPTAGADATTRAAAANRPLSPRRRRRQR